MISARASCTAFDGARRIARGALVDVALAVKAAQEKRTPGPLLVFDDATGEVVDLDLRGSAKDVAARLADWNEAPVSSPRKPRRGLPKLGVVAREVTLLPQHWRWLAMQRGGASATLRRLVHEAQRSDAGRSDARAARDGAYRFMSAMAGVLPGFEEAARALFANDGARLKTQIAPWPRDVRRHVLMLAGIPDG